MGYKRSLFFAAGALTGMVAGTLGVSLLGDKRFRPALTSAIRTAFETKEMLLARMETFKEDVEDLLVEARQQASRPGGPEGGGGESESDAGTGKKTSTAAKNIDEQI